MTFRANLFDLLSRAQKVFVNGYEIDSFHLWPESTPPAEWPNDPLPGSYELDCGDDTSFVFFNQEVEVDIAGSCDAVAFTHRLAGSDGKEPTKFFLEFLVERPITKEDL